MLEMQEPKVKTIRLTFDSTSHTSQSQLNFSFVCSSCPQTWPLEDSASISAHFAQHGTAPLIKPHRLAFSSLYQYYTYKVKLLVNPMNRQVSSKTFLSCNE